MAANMDLSTRMFQASLCQSRSLVDNLEPAGARLVSDLQKQIEKLKGDIEVERNRCRSMARDHLLELKRVREEQENRLDSNLEALSQRKNSEKQMELKKLEESLHREREIAVKALQREKVDELRILEKRLTAEYEEKLRYSLEQERRHAFNEAQAQLPDEDELVARETKLTKEVFSLGGENMRLEDQVKHLTSENKSQIELIRKMKKEHEAEIEALVRKNKSEAARDSARLRLGEQLIQERESEFMDMCHRAETAEREIAELQNEIGLLKATLDASSKLRKEKEMSSGAAPSPQSLRRSGNMFKQVEELEYSVRRLEDEKSVLKQENASLRKKLSQDSDTKDSDDKMKRLRKRNADLVTLTKTLEERCKVLKLENTKLQDKQVLDNSDIEQQIRKTLSRQHAKDISDYTRKIASKDREIIELKRKLSKYEVSGAGARLEPLTETSKKMKTLSLEKLRAEKLIAKLYSHLPDDADVQLSKSEFSNEAVTVERLSEENTALLRQLRQRDEVDGGRGESGRGLRKAESVGSIMQATAAAAAATSTAVELESVRELRDENQRLSQRIDELARLQRANDDLNNQLIDTQLMASSSEKKLKIAEEDLEQARLASQEYERAQEHCTELEEEITVMRGNMNDKDREICQLQLEKKAQGDQLKEKEEEIKLLKDRVSLLKSEVNKGEELVKELQHEIESLSQRPDTENISLQTSPLYSPKRFPKSSQTSPLAGPKLTTLTNKIIEETTPITVDKQKGVSAPPTSDLHAEMAAVGVAMSDSYDSEVPTSEENLTNQISSENTTQNNSFSEVGAVEQEKATPTKLLMRSGDVSLYIVCDDYYPNTMSPNPDSDRELSLKKGEYVYIEGSEDDVGFFVGFNVNGKKGLIPSNYVKKLTDSPFQSLGHAPSSASPVPPPLSLELTRQFVQDDAYCLAIHWEHPKLLPQLLPPHDSSGYRVYVNSELKATVSLSEETFVMLNGIPRNQYIYVSVRTFINDLESCDPNKLIEINPQYPEVPYGLSLSPTDSLQYQLSWKLHRSPPPLVSSLNYRIYINHSLLLKTVPLQELGTNGIGSFFVSIGASDMQFDHAPLTPPLSLSIRVSDDVHISSFSSSLPLPSQLYDLVLIKEHHDDTSSVTSVLSNGVGVASSSLLTSNSGSSLPEITEVTVGSFYRALYSYDPSVSSPNGEGASEELTFYENCVIKALSELDEDGFFLGACDGREGLVPKNMVQPIPSDKEASDYDQPLSNGDDHYQLVQAVYDYDPITQSPNEDHKDEELAFARGDYITVYGGPVDGFYEGELNGRRGYVPKSFVTPVSNVALMKSLNNNNNKNSLQQSIIES